MPRLTSPVTVVTYAATDADNEMANQGRSSQPADTQFTSEPYCNTAASLGDDQNSQADTDTEPSGQFRSIPIGSEHGGDQPVTDPLREAWRLLGGLDIFTLKVEHLLDDQPDQGGWAVSELRYALGIVRAQAEALHAALAKEGR